MDPINQSVPPMMDNQPAANGHKKVGPIVTAFVIIFILIVAGIYFFASSVDDGATPADTTATETTNTSVTTEVKTVTSTSDDVSDLQADLDSSVNGIDDQNF